MSETYDLGLLVCQQFEVLFVLFLVFRMCVLSGTYDFWCLSCSSSIVLNYVFWPFVGMCCLKLMILGVDFAILDLFC